MYVYMNSVFNVIKTSTHKIVKNIYYLIFLKYLKEELIFCSYEVTCICIYIYEYVYIINCNMELQHDVSRTVYTNLKIEHFT